MTNENLITRAITLIKPKQISHYITADVGCVLESESGNVYLGVNIDIHSGMGFCGEHAAIAAMITAGEYRIKKIVAVWKDEKGDIYVLPPCGRCRGFMYKIDKQNLEADIVWDKNKTVKLKELLPYVGVKQKV